MELAEAIAWLENLGVVHGDLRSSNVLFDDEDHVKLADFDSMADCGSQSPGNNAPWSRSVGSDCPNEIAHGLFGARTEQFAFGSTLCNLTHGHQVCEGMRPDILQILEDLIFPQLSDSPLNNITVQCWNGAFKILADLSSAVALLNAGT